MGKRCFILSEVSVMLSGVLKFVKVEKKFKVCLFVVCSCRVSMGRLLVLVVF